MRNKIVSIILPTYDEAGNIIPLIESIQEIFKKHKLAYEIIVIDDNSPDGTAKLIKIRFGNFLNVKIKKRLSKTGLASAIKDGISLSHGEFIIVMDTDFNHDPKELPKMLKHIMSNDLVIGSRYIGNGGMENHLRQHLSFLFNVFLKLLLGHNVNDNLSGFFTIRRDYLKSLPQEKIFYGFGDYFIRLIYAVHKRKGKIKEIPVFYKNRIYGASKSKFLNMLITYTYSSIKLRLTI